MKEEKRGSVPENGERMNADEYGLLMSSLDVSVSKHRMDEHFTVLWANERYYSMFGYTKEEYESLFHNECDLFYKGAEEEWEALRIYVNSVFSTGARKYEYVCRMRHKCGKKLWIKLVGNLTDEMVDGRPVSYTVMMDITEQMQLQVEQTVTYNNFPGLISKHRVKADGLELLNANKKYFAVFPEREFYSWKGMALDQGLESVLENYDLLRRGEPLNLTISPMSVSGKRLHMRMTSECVDWVDGDPVYLTIYSDITQLVEQNRQELERLAYTDPVTNGMNRLHFDEEAGKAIHSQPAGSYILIWLNMEKFKLINDYFGDEAGDRTLRYVHDVITTHLEKGEYVSRVAADHFTLLLKNRPDSEICGRLNRIAEDINRFNRDLANRYILSFSAGAYRINDLSLEITQIQDRAHVALNTNTKVNDDLLCACHFYSERERERLMAEKEVENRMRGGALARREFEVYLQPKLMLKDGIVSGAEALVRWNHPDRGMVPPDEFIPIFEKNGFITQLDLFVFEEVCRLLRRWMDVGLEPVPISVNVSRAHFSEPNFMDLYEEIRAKYEIPPRFLEIEITETIIFEETEKFSRIVSQIHQYGFTCSMDDFGSGYSSLNILKDLDVDALKLDRAFFRSANMDNPKERDVVSSVVELAKKLDMVTIAEGVETGTQQDFLVGTECDMLQGYVYSRPLPIAEFEKLVYQRRDAGEEDGGTAAGSRG